MRVLVTPTFERAVKKMRAQQKEILDEAIRDIIADPDLGGDKVGDLVGIKVYKFHMGKMLTLLAYRVLNENTLKLLMVGPHENFYRTLKRIDY
ncbi:MAG: type II toxin-antitoxin system RelE/ParE family toxin [Marinobacterium sp.]